MDDFEGLNTKDVIIRCASIGLMKENVAHILGISEIQFMRNKEYVALYDLHLSKTLAKLAAVVVDKSFESPTMALKVLQIHGKWQENRTTKLEGYTKASYQKAMEILDEALSNGRLSIADYALIAKVRTDRLGAEEAMREVKEIRTLTDELIEKNRLLEEQNEHFKTLLHVDISKDNEDEFK